jgi:nicotinamide-nucleotide amidase
VTLHVELLITGDEVMRGAIVDTHSAWLAQRLPASGATLRRVTTVGDVAEDIRGALREASARADVVVSTGGMGPTSDDLTMECVGEVTGLPLVLHEETLARIKERWARRGRPMPTAVERQALVPRGSEVLTNDEGTAPGVTLRIGRAQCFFFAAVPIEMRHLAERHLFPWLGARADSVAVTRTLRCAGIPESELDAALLPLAKEAGLRLGLRATWPETWASLTCSAPDAPAARARLAPVVDAAVAKLFPKVYSVNDESLSQVVGGLLLKAGWTVSVAESCTGGSLGGELTGVAGSSRYFPGGAITYSNEEKTRALGVPSSLIEAHGAVSEPVARAMAEGAVAAIRSTAALAITGVAGPDGGTTEKPVGTVWVALASPRGTIAELHRFPRRDRDSVRRASVTAALDLLRRTLLEGGA